MAFGDVSLTIRADGVTADLTVEGFSVGASLNSGLGTNNAAIPSAKLALLITSMGFTNTGNATTALRSSYGTHTVRKAWPNDASVDESVSGGNYTVRISLSDPVFQKDKAGGGNSGVDIIASALAGLVVNTGGGGQSSNAGTFTVTNNSTLPYPKVIGRWAWPGFERVTGDYLVEFVCFHAFAKDGQPVACVKIDATDQHSNSATQQLAQSMLPSTKTGDAKTVWVYSATIPVSALTDGDQVTGRARCYPWIGDSSSVLDTDTSADGVAAPSESLSPLMFFLDKANTRACYASVDGVGAGTPTVQTTAALARTTPYSTIANALTALKSFNNSNHSDNSLNCCVILMQNGTYTGPGTFTGSNTKSWCIVQADIANGATESSVVFSTATNAACSAYLKFQDVSFTGSGTGMLRGSGTAGALWLHSCTLNNTASPFQYAWRVIFATQNTISALSQGFLGFSTNRGPWALVRGNDASSASAAISAHPYCMIGNKRLCSGNTAFQETGNSGGNDLSENSIIAWNECLNSSNQFLAFGAASSTVTKGIAYIGNLFERVVDNTQAAFVLSGDNANLSNVSNILIFHNTIAGQRCNLNYQEGGNVTVTRQNWYERYNLFRDANIKSDTFQNPQRSVTDGVLNSTKTITSATANFVAGDVGQIISGTGLPNGFTTIASVTNSTTAVLAAAAVATATGVKLGIRGYIQDSARIGNWPMLYGCGCRGSRYELATFPRDFAGIDVAAVGAGGLGYTNDKSVNGETGGNGDYTPTTNSVARSRVAAGLAMIPGDFNGVAVDNVGRGLAGAIQVAFPVTSFPILSGLSSNILGC